MDKKQIDNIVWWIPFRKLRDSIRCYFDTISNIENNTLFINQFQNNYNNFNNLFLNRINIIFNLSKYYNLNIENFGDTDLKPFWDNNIFKNKNIDNITVNDLIEKIKNAFDLEKLEKSYYLLKDEYSKNMFISTIISRTTKYNGLALILYYGNSWKYYYDLYLAKMDEVIEINNSKLYLYDLSKLPFSKDIKLYYTQRQLFETYFLEQYRYKNKVYAEKGDYIIDGGGATATLHYIFQIFAVKAEKFFHLNL